MIPYDIDPSLHTAEPGPQRLEDGFSPPHHGMAAQPIEPGHTPAPTLPPKPADPEPHPEPLDPEKGRVKAPEPGKPEHPAV